LLLDIAGKLAKECGLMYVAEERVGDEVAVDGEVRIEWDVEVEREGATEGGILELIMEEKETASILLSLSLGCNVVAKRCAIGNGIGSLSAGVGGVGSSTRISAFECFVPSLKNLDFLFGAAEVEER
jgi:hypothetical protein